LIKRDEGRVTATSFDLDRPLALHPLRFLEDGDEVTVGRPDIESYGVFPADGAALLRKLADGMSPRDAASWYAAEYGEPVDIVEFLEVLDEFDLLVREGDQRVEPGRIRWQRLGAAMFSVPAWLVYTTVLTAAVVAMLREPDLTPHYRNIFFTPSLVLLMLVLFLGQFPLILVHEGFHALAGRRLGLRSTLRIGQRFYYVVLETALDGLVTVPRRRRYLPILAGMLADLLVIAVLTLAAAWSRTGTGDLTIAGKVCLAFAFATVLRVVWQFYLFLRTDLYYLVTVVLGCNDLHTVSVQLLRNRFDRLLRRPGRHDETAWHPRDRAVARWYSWLLVGGYVFLVVILLVAVIPVITLLVRIIADRLTGTPTTLGVLDAVVFVVASLAQFAAAGVLARRNRRTQA
jgi:hypothetical protein